MLSKLACSPARQGIPSNGLTSLLDMLEAKAKPFFMAGDILSQMLIYGEDQNVTSFHWTSVNHIRKLLLELREQLVSLNAPQCVMASADRAIAHLDSGWSPAALRHDAIELRSRLMDELGGEFLLSLSSKEKELYAPNSYLFGEKVNDAFPPASLDIEEAGKCLALGRSTACVLHLMRALEAPLRAMAVAVGADPKKENWNSILNDIETETRGLDAHGNRTKKWDGRKEEQAFYADAASQFFHFKNAWRNYAAHGNDAYTQEKASEIFASVKAFFVHLSVRLASKP